MNEKSAIDNFGIYKTWVVAKNKPNEKQSHIYLPDFEEAGAFRLPKNLSDDQKGARIHGRLNHYISKRLANKQGVNPSMSVANLEEIYPYTNAKLIKVNMWSIINRIYPPQENTKQLLLPASTQNNKGVNLNFWVVINEAPDDYQEDATQKSNYNGDPMRYEVIFPEIDVHRYHTIAAHDISEFYDKIDDTLLKDFEDCLVLGDEHPRKWSKKEIMDDYQYADDVRKHSVPMDNYLDILKRRDLKKTPLVRIRRYPTSEHLKQWPPKPPQSPE